MQATIDREHHLPYLECRAFLLGYSSAMLACTLSLGASPPQQHGLLLPDGPSVHVTKLGQVKPHGLLKPMPRMVSEAQTNVLAPLAQAFEDILDTDPDAPQTLESGIILADTLAQPSPSPDPSPDPEVIVPSITGPEVEPAPAPPKRLPPPPSISPPVPVVKQWAQNFHDFCERGPGSTGLCWPAMWLLGAQDAGISAVASLLGNESVAAFAVPFSSDDLTSELTLTGDESNFSKLFNPSLCTERARPEACLGNLPP